jgi:hypothetical protein
MWMNRFEREFAEVLTQEDALLSDISISIPLIGFFAMALASFYLLRARSIGVFSSLGALLASYLLITHLVPDENLGDVVIGGMTFQVSMVTIVPMFGLIVGLILFITSWSKKRKTIDRVIIGFSTCFAAFLILSYHVLFVSFQMKESYRVIESSMVRSVTSSDSFLGEYCSMPDVTCVSGPLGEEPDVRDKIKFDIRTRGASHREHYQGAPFCMSYSLVFPGEAHEGAPREATSYAYCEGEEGYLAALESIPATRMLNSTVMVLGIVVWAITIFWCLFSFVVVWGHKRMFRGRKAKA